MPYHGFIHIISGSPSITSVVYYKDSNAIICTSTGGPPTIVTWRRDGISVSTSIFQQSKRLVNAETAKYENILYTQNDDKFVGTFTCEVSNVRGSVNESVKINGEDNDYIYLFRTKLMSLKTDKQLQCPLFIIILIGLSISHDQLKIGAKAIVKCISNVMHATKMEWLSSGVVVNKTGPQDLQSTINLIFSPVNDSIHNQVFVCRLTTTDGREVEQNFTAKVDGKY